MMMNFLDLSAASEEERRLIKEILSDTSVVNFNNGLHQDTATAATTTTTLTAAATTSTNINNTSSTNTITDTNRNNNNIIIGDISTSANTSNINSSNNNNNNNRSINNNNVSSNLSQPQQQQPQHHHHHQHQQQQQQHSTSTVPPQTTATQMPPHLAGDMNSVMAMDMAATQPPSYAIPPPPPPPAHVTAFGPPPTHHVYGGPPIFQSYAPYFLQYNLQPYHYVLPPTNSVVQPRQQILPQSNQPPGTNNTQSSHSRSHSHHIRTKKVLDPSRQQHLQHQQTHLQQPHHQHHQEFRNNAQVPIKTIDASDKLPEEFRSDGSEANQHNNYVPKQDNQVNSNDIHDSTERQPHHLEEVNNSETVKPHNEDEGIKMSSDEGFDTQSSLDVSKQSHESPMPTSEQSKSPKEDSNNSNVEKKDNVDVEVVEINNKAERRQPNQEKVSGPSASKSWASLFKGDGTALIGPAMNGETNEHSTVDSDNSDNEENRHQLRTSNRIEKNAAQTSRAVSTKEQRSQEAARRALDKLAPRLAQKINSINLKHSLPLLRPRGFINKGNFCYINSTLQALIACPPFYNLMKEIGDLRGLKRENSCTPILDNFAELFLNFPPLDAGKKNKQSTSSDQKLQMNYLQAEAIEPKCIYNVLGKIKFECTKGAQEDAEEFLSSVLNGLHEEMIDLSDVLHSMQENSNNQNGHLSDAEDINGDLNNDENLWREVGPKNRSLPMRTATVINTPIQEIFGGSLFSIRTAGKDRCGHRSPFFDLQLDISGDKVKSLEDAIKSFTATEIIQDFYCSKTKQKLDAQRRTCLDQLPPILILHLKQFVYTHDHGLRKLMKRIDYPIDFELPDVCLHDKNSDKSLKNSRTYKLLAVVYHEGREAYKGHYLTDVFHIGSSQWIRCDDSNLKVVPSPRIENQDSSRTPYLLFYRRLNTLRPPHPNNHDNKKKSG